MVVVVVRDTATEPTGHKYEDIENRIIHSVGFVGGKSVTRYALHVELKNSKTEAGNIAPNRGS